MSLDQGEHLPVLSYELAEQDANLFITGCPMSGKSTIAPLLSATIRGTTVQNFDIFRSVNLALDTANPLKEQNPFLGLGSCDAFLGFKDPSYSKDKLVEGYRLHSRAMCEILGIILPTLETQGAHNVIFEGVQLSPVGIEPFVRQSDSLVVIVASRHTLEERRLRQFGRAGTLAERYSLERLMTIQDELIAQALGSEPRRAVIIDSDRGPVPTTNHLLHELEAKGIVVQTAI